MARKSTANTFEKGLVMDLNPITTPNNVMTSALNATMLTFNGSEYVLQSDMGNGRVETAYLPEGFIPVGIVEFGGIIYVASYNPLIGKSQLGSFPSPERNISTEEINQAVIELSNMDFGFNANNGATTFYVQKNLYADKLTPGDKYIVYTGNGKISSNVNKLWDCADGTPNAVNIGGQNTTKAVKISFATITDEGKIVKLTNLKTYTVDGIGGKYIIPEITYSGGKPNLDAYRSIIQSPYNVFNSKVSGKLLLIAELVTIDEFNVAISCEFIGPDSAKTKDVKIYTNISYGSDNNVFLYAVEARVTDSGASSSNLHFKWNKTTIENGEQIEGNRDADAEMYTVSGYNYTERPERNISYNITPCMSFGPIKYLMRSGVIQLDKIGTGYISLYEWRYYVDNGNIMINWALQSYPEEGYEIAGIRFIMSCINREGNVETAVYNVSKKQSYNGSFMENIPFDSDFYKFSQGKLLRDRLYYVTIEVQYQKSVAVTGEDITSRYKYFHRWMYSSSIFNKDYLDGKITDFMTIKPSLTMANKSEFQFNQIENTETSTTIGKINELVEEVATLDPLDSLSATQYFNRYKLSGNISNVFANDYGVFDIDLPSITNKISINKENASVTFDDYSITSTSGDVTLLAETTLTLKQNETWDGQKTEMPIPDKAKELAEDPFNHGIWVNNYTATVQGDKSQIKDIEVKTIEYVKILASMMQYDVKWSGEVRPLAYNVDTFSKYNLQFDEALGGFRTGFLGSFCTASENSSGKSRPRTCMGRLHPDWYKTEIFRTHDWINFINDNMYDKLRDIYSVGISSSIIFTAWANRAGKYWSGLQYKSNGRYKNWAFNTVDNNCACFLPNGQDVNNMSAILVLMKLKSNGRYIPINMAAQFGSSRAYADMPFSTPISGIRNIYTAIATMLIQLYSFESNGGSQKRHIVDTAFYIKRVLANFNINIDIETNIDNIKIKIKTDNDKKIYVNEIKTPLFDGNKKQSKNKTNDVIEDGNLDNNIEFSINTESNRATASIAAMRDSSDLLNNILQSSQKEFETMVYSASGETRSSNVSGSDQYIYSLDDSGNLNRLSSSFKLRECKFSQSGNRIIAKFGSNTISPDGAFLRKLTLDNGMLVLDDSSGESLESMNAVSFRLYTRNNDHNEHYHGFSSFAPIDKLKFFDK